MANVKRRRTELKEQIEHCEAKENRTDILVPIESKQEGEKGIRKERKIYEQ